MVDELEPHLVIRSKPIPVKQVLPETWQEMTLRWMFDQGVATVLLVCIMVAIVWGVPDHIIPAVQSGYRLNAESLERTTKLHVEARSKEVELLMQVHERDRQAFERAINVMERRP